jgi:SAM-dependent methyltransferase
LGNSVRSELHPVAVDAVAEIASRRTEAPVRMRSPLRGDIDRAMSRALADWIVERASDTNPDHLSDKTTSYLLTSGAHRALAIATVLRGLRKSPIRRLVDIGTAVGLIPWLLLSDFPEIRSVELFEPNRRFRTALDGLWQCRAAGQDYSVAHANAEDAGWSTGVDVVMFCHCMLLVAPEQRRAVLQRAWDSLTPGGVLLINERLKDDSTPNPERPDIIHREEMIAIMPGAPKVYARRTGWRQAKDPCRVTARELAYSGVLASVREG